VSAPAARLAARDRAAAAGPGPWPRAIAIVAACGAAAACGDRAPAGPRAEREALAARAPEPAPATPSPLSPPPAPSPQAAAAPPPAAPSPPSPPPAPSPQAAAASGPIPLAARELLTAVVDDWGATSATLQRWRRAGPGEPWRAVAEPWPGVIGRGGAAWGRGLHGEGAPRGRGGPRKREGDGASPAGAFALRAAYGYADAPPKGARLPYTAVDERHVCVDDPRSRHYQTVLDGRAVARDWRSAEQMRRPDALYAWVIDVGHNPQRIAQAGSCIFLHVWRDARTPTVGCTAMAEPVLAELLATLDPDAVLVLLPRAEYLALAAPWGLPAR
jgi:L,D-peptidoglycan transpeptidase YkuD (ErfK/YbiS/YcfS/YnhG family)